MKLVSYSWRFLVCKRILKWLLFEAHLLVYNMALLFSYGFAWNFLPWIDKLPPYPNRFFFINFEIFSLLFISYCELQLKRRCERIIRQVFYLSIFFLFVNFNASYWSIVIKLIGKNCQLKKSYRESPWIMWQCFMRQQ